MKKLFFLFSLIISSTVFGQYWQQAVDYKIAVELKTDYRYPLDKLTNDFPFENIRFSKYCEAFDELNIYQK